MQLINANDLLAVNWAEDTDPNSFGWDDVIDDVLQQCTIWGIFYLLEKIMIVYITVHYHYRSNLGRIEHSKDMHNALMTLYDASVYLYPVGRGQFEEEDIVIRSAYLIFNYMSMKALIMVQTQQGQSTASIAFGQPAISAVSGLTATG